MKEMDLIFGRFADERLSSLGERELRAYEALLDENDQDLYLWVSGAAQAPEIHDSILSTIAAFHGIER